MKSFDVFLCGGLKIVSHEFFITQLEKGNVREFLLLERKNDDEILIFLSFLCTLLVIEQLYLVFYHFCKFSCIPPLIKCNFTDFYLFLCTPIDVRTFYKNFTSAPYFDFYYNFGCKFVDVVDALQLVSNGFLTTHCERNFPSNQIH